MSEQLSTSLSAPCQRWNKVERFEGWRVVPRTYISSADRRFDAYFIVSPSGERCAVILNGFALGTFPTGDHCRFRSPSDAPTSFDETDLDLVVSKYSEDDDDLSFEDDEAVNSSKMFSDDGEDLSGIDLEFVNLTLSPNGQRVVFSGGCEGKRFLFLDGKCAPIEGKLCGVFFSEDSSRICLWYEGESNEDPPYFFCVDGVVTNAMVLYSTFTSDSEHFVSILRDPSNPDEFARDDFSVDGEVVMSNLELQRWNIPGETEDLEFEGQIIALDDRSRSVLFGVWEKIDGSDEPEPVLMIYSLVLQQMHRHPGIRILSAENSKSGDMFELVILSSKDDYKVPKKISFARAV